MCLVEMENLGGRGSPDIRQWEEVVVLIHLTLQNKRTEWEQHQAYVEAKEQHWKLQVEQREQLLAK